MIFLVYNVQSGYINSGYIQMQIACCLPEQLVTLSVIATYLGV